MIKSRLILMAGLLAAGSLASCTDEVPAIPSSELYTREWVKQFGVVDAAQDWNNATRGSVDVNVEGPARVRVTTMIDGTNYLLADYADVNGSRKLEFDMPRGVKDIKVSAGAASVATKVGAVATLSRQAMLSGSAKADDVEVTVTNLEGDHSFLTLEWPEILHFTEDLILENDNAQNDYENTSLALKNYTKDFTAVADTFWIFPQYWNTGSYNKNQIGIYYYVDASEEGKDGVHKVKYRTKTGATKQDHEYETRYVRRIEIFNGLITQLQGSEAKKSVVDSDEKGQYMITAEEKAALVENYPDEYKVDEDGTLNVFTSGEGWSKWVNEFINDKNAGNVLANHLANLFPDKYCVYNWGVLGITKYEPTGSLDQPDVKKFYDWNSYEKLISTGVQIVFNKKTQFGFYLSNGDDNGLENDDQLSNVRYSEMALNPSYEFPVKQEDGSTVNEYKDVSYVGTILDTETDSYGNDKRYLCFEDWMGQNRNFDINDMVFRIYGFDNLKEHPNPDGEIVDKEAEPIKWLVACEDLGAMDDFDFNDVVFEVEYVAGRTTATITPLAAGGTLETYLMRDGEKTNMLEWHALFGVPVSTMVNTGRATAKAKSYTITVPEGFTLTSSNRNAAGDASHENYRKNMGGFYLHVERADGAVETVEAPGPGEAPQMILIFQKEGKKWRWPTERTNIRTAYPKFKEWSSPENGFKLDAEGENWFDIVGGPANSVFNR